MLTKKITPKTENTLESLQTKITALKKKIAKESTSLVNGENWKVNAFKDTPLSRALTSREGILQVPKRTKSFGSKLGIFRPKNVVIHLETCNDELSYIKLNEFIDVEETKLSTLPKTLITTVDKKERRQQFFINDLNVVTLLNEIRELSIELGIIEYSIADFYTKKFDDKLLTISDWEDSWEAPDQHGLWYDKVNDPMILECFKEQAVPMAEKNGNKPFTILDVGGGKGRLAEKLINEALNAKINIHYILLEPTNQINAAKARLQDLEKNTKCTITFTQSSLKDIDMSNKVHCVISSGGPLNLDIVTRQLALEHITKIKQALLPQGLVIATGLTGLVVKAKHFTKAGLDVLSYATPSITPSGYEKHPFIKAAESCCGFFGNYQRYVCKKTDRGPNHSLEDSVKSPALS